MLNKEVKEQKRDSFWEDLMELKNEIGEPKPWKVTYLRESTDKKYDIYSYKLIHWWNKWWIKNKYISQIWPWVQWTQFTDAQWHEITKDKFDAWEVVYLRVPKKSRETIDPIPEITFDEILNLTDREIWKICDNHGWSIFGSKSPADGRDKKWEYFIVKGKKLYCWDAKNGGPNWVYVYYDWWSEEKMYAFFRKTWNNYSWIYYDSAIWSDKIYRWNLKKDNYWCICPVNDDWWH